MRALEYLALIVIALGTTYLVVTPVAHAIAQSIEHSAAIVANPQATGSIR